MKTRAEFNRFLEEHTVPGRVYFQAPEKTNLVLPYIVYDISKASNKFADNSRYLRFNRYAVTLVTKHADDPIIKKLLELPYSELDRHFVTDRLHNYHFAIYF